MAAYFTGDIRKNKRDKPLDLPHPLGRGLDSPEGYYPEEGLVDAVNVAIVLGQPLLLTGEPGTGKTQLAYAVAEELGFDKPLKFETKSNSTSRDLFYFYDTVGRFHAAQTQDRTADPLHYITYNALGIAILRANDSENVKQWLPNDFSHSGKSRSIVLIDEIDKAPRDFPNDILNEIEHMYFKIPELGNPMISAPSSMQPLVIITSNSEKHLPNAFLRRCIFYHIPFPNEELLLQIVKSRVGEYIGNSIAFQEDALEFFYTLRSVANGLQRKPATVELLNWIVALKEMSKEKSNPMRGDSKILEISLSILIKNGEDMKQAKRLLSQWIASS